MIKIIEYGTKTITTCNSCGCKFSYEKEDIVYENIDNYKALIAYINCPQCGERVFDQPTPPSSKSAER